jgi:hypothetical protein
MTFTFEGGDNYETRFDIIPGVAFSIFNEEGERLTYNYCENDLADEVVGMWVCNDGPQNIENDMIIRTYGKDGKVATTGIYTEDGNADPIKNSESNYKVVGDLVFKEFPKDISDITGITHSAERLIYTPNATELGDMMTLFFYLPVGDGFMESYSSYLRIKQNLDLAGKAYDYSATYISNAKGADKDIPFLDTKFNFAHMDGSIIDKFLKSVLYNVQFPDAKTFQYNCLLEGQNVSLQLPMEVEGNKITIKMSSRHEAYRDVVVYAFQDVDGCQFHMYMPTASFENFFSNLSLSILSASGQVDINNPVHVDAVYKEVADAIESINVSIVMK